MVTAAACIRHEQRQYDKLDAIDEASCRPDFGVGIYPGLIIDNDGKLRPELTPNEKTPPMFFAQAIDDRVKAENAIVLALALKAVNVPAELHIYDAGGHGFGLQIWFFCAVVRSEASATAIKPAESGRLPRVTICSVIVSSVKIGFDGSI